MRSQRRFLSSRLLRLHRAPGVVGLLLSLPLLWSLPDAGSGLGLEEVIEDVVGLEQPRSSSVDSIRGVFGSDRAAGPQSLSTSLAD